jgi:hypothetical protein
VKFLHTSDIWLGHGFPFVRSVAEEFREARMQAIRDLVALGQRHQVEALVLAGNTLADNRISRYTVEDMAALFSECEFPVLILPGLRDPLTPDSPFRTRPELFASPMQVLDGTVPISVSGVEFWAFPTVDRSGVYRATPLPDESSRPRVGIACLSPDQFSDTELADQNFDYLALGGATRPHEIGNAVWSGAPEASEPGESGGAACLVEIGKGEVSTKSIPIGQLHWLEEQWPFQDLQALSDAVDSLKEPARTKLQLRLTGSMSFRDLGLFDSWVEQTRPRFLDLWVDYPEKLVIHDEDLYSHPLLRQVTERLLDISSQPTGERDPAFASDSESARWALGHLQRLLKDTPHKDLM